MLRIEETLDIKKIEELRKQSGGSLDAHDNFSWHIVLAEDGEALGVARLYNFSDGLFLDDPCVPGNEEKYCEALFRTLLLKAVELKKTAYTKQAGGKKKHGFAAFGDIMKADYKSILFPKRCKETNRKSEEKTYD